MTLILTGRLWHGLGRRVPPEQKNDKNQVNKRVETHVFLLLLDLLLNLRLSLLLGSIESVRLSSTGFNNVATSKSNSPHLNLCDINWAAGRRQRFRRWLLGLVKLNLKLCRHFRFSVLVFISLIPFVHAGVYPYIVLPRRALWANFHHSAN